MAVDNIQLIAGNHAIEVVNFVIVFPTPLDSGDEARFEESINELRNQFAAIEKPGVFRFVVGNGPAPDQANPVMYHLNHFSHNGKPEWSAQFGENAVAISCRKYTNWDAVWASACFRLTSLLRCVDEFKPVASIQYGVTDTFIEPVGIPTEDRQLFASNILNNGTWVPDAIVEYSDPRWDFQAGKFLEEIDGHDVLERVEARSVISGSNIVANLTNTLSLKYKNIYRVKDLLVENNEGTDLSRTFGNFRELNKRTIRQILKAELADKMGLT